MFMELFDSRVLMIITATGFLLICRFLVYFGGNRIVLLEAENRHKNYEAALHVAQDTVKEICSPLYPPLVDDPG